MSIVIRAAGLREPQKQIDCHGSGLHFDAGHIFVKHRRIVRQTLLSSDFGGERLGVQRLAGGMFGQTVPVE